jgi:two-component system, NtrC family, sensor kinase
MPVADSKLALLAHEINNPLDSVLNLLHLVRAEGVLTEHGLHYLTLAEEELQRVAEIAHAALDCARLNGALHEANIPVLMNSVVDVYRMQFEARGISVKTRYGAVGDISVYATPLRQVFSNLLLNAADAMPEGGRLLARVCVAREHSGKHRRGVRLTIADNGCGIAAEKLHAIFEPFFTTKGSAGSGLGLALVKDVVAQHGGRLHVRSSTRPGHSGTVFAIFLPMGKANLKLIRAGSALR